MVVMVVMVLMDRGVGVGVVWVVAATDGMSVAKAGRKEGVLGCAVVKPGGRDRSESVSHFHISFFFFLFFPLSVLVGGLGMVTGFFIVWHLCFLVFGCRRVLSGDWRERRRCSLNNKQNKTTPQHGLSWPGQKARTTLNTWQP